MMIHIPLEKAYNVRDLGGYCAKDNKSTKFHKFLRADGMTELTQNDIKKLVNYGVKTIIDLRNLEELDKNINSFVDYTSIKYKNISVLKNFEIDWLEVDVDDAIGYSYKLMIDTCGDEIKETFEQIAENVDNGCVLIHCTAGKDRTGIAAALLLDLVGVDYADIVANYEVSHTYIKKMLFEVEVSPDIPLVPLLSEARSMEILLDHLYKKYNGARNYLLSIGLTENQLDLIEANFLE